VVEELRIRLKESLRQSWAHRRQGSAPRALGRGRNHTVEALGWGSRSPAATDVAAPVEKRRGFEYWVDPFD